MRSLLAVGLALLLVPSAPGCSSGPACAVDTDCPLGNRCDVDGTCHEVGEVRDSGPSMVDSGARDAPSTDARADVSEGGPPDSGPPDAGSDAGAACPGMAGTYAIGMFTACPGSPAATTMTLIEEPPMTCMFSVSLDGTDAGILAASDTAPGQLLGALAIGSAGAVACRATFTAGAVEVMCDDGCAFGGTRS